MMRTSDCPSLKRKPSDYMREMYYSSQPMEKPDDQVDPRGDLSRVITPKPSCSVGHPHWDFRPPRVIYDLPFHSNILAAMPRGCLDSTQRC